MQLICCNYTKTLFDKRTGINLQGRDLFAKTFFGGKWGYAYRQKNHPQKVRGKNPGT